MAKTNVTIKGTKKVSLDDLYGVIPIRMTNDYLFRALMQRNSNVLKSLICSLLHLDLDDVTSVTILNPIELGETIDDKNYILDIKVELNGYTTINLEMQVVNEGNWPERSLCYLCRVFDNLNRGEDYEDVRPAIQIGLLDFTLFQDSPEFFANYYLMNAKNHRIYSDKFRLSVLDLTQINLATETDRAYRIDCWAALFKATTWEELKMLAK
ncbi:MAG: Rpn family recombination-promoting nuclease/putative transposase, partial [Lachnospiraceae bacterium]|nr:Rpn family recombination-promoting nuclease/putative transposase [Lachnospiraceae bacterium]